MTHGAHSPERPGEPDARATSARPSAPAAPAGSPPDQPPGLARSPVMALLAVIALGVALFALPLLALGGRDELLPLDREVGLAARDLAASGAESIAAAVTVLGSFPVVAAAVAVAAVRLAVSRSSGTALALVLGFAAVVIAVHLIKADVGRLRPPGATPYLTTASFPSGHAAYATAYTALALALTAVRSPRRRRTRLAVVVGSLALTVAIGLTRVVLGVHYLSDVVAGWALGATIFALAAAVVTVGPMRHTEHVGGKAPEDGSVRP